MTEFNAQNWVKRWEAQQTAYLPDRENRFNVMFDCLEARIVEGQLAPNFKALDLCCGCGSLSARLLKRFPNAQVTALDLDPVLLELGQQTLGERLRWHEADLQNSHWADGLGSFDVVLSTTALHWLPHAALQQVYGQVFKLLEPKGFILNGDHFAFSPHLRGLQAVALRVKKTRQDAAWAAGAEDWKNWWVALEQEAILEPLFVKRRQRFPESTIRYAAAPNFDFHLACLHDAGFFEVTTIWQNMDNRVLIAVKE